MLHNLFELLSRGIFVVVWRCSQLCQVPRLGQAGGVCDVDCNFERDPLADAD